MLVAERRQQILRDIEQTGAGKVSDLSRKYAVSEMTIRRDLKFLHEEGRLHVTHGGAVRRSSKQDHEPVYTAKKTVNAAQKRRLARYAAETFIDDGDIIFLEAGTTVASMAPFLTKRDLTIVTNGLYTINELQQLVSQAQIICCGGILRGGALTFVGPHAEQFFREFHANKLFLSGTGLTLSAGLTDPSMIETQVKKAMLTSVDRVIVLLDASKFGVTSLSTSLRAAEIDVLVTEAAAPADTVDALRRLGVEVHVVPT